VQFRIGPMGSGDWENESHLLRCPRVARAEPHRRPGMMGHGPRVPGIDRWMGASAVISEGRMPVAEDPRNAADGEEAS
jgi:hypothetical protein